MSIRTDKLEKKLNKFLISKRKEVNIDLIALYVLSDILKELGYEQIGYEANSFEVDYIMYLYNKEVKKYISISGSLWNSNIIWVTKEDKNELQMYQSYLIDIAEKTN